MSLIRRSAAAALGVAAALLLAACGGDDGTTGDSDDSVTIEWWHINPTDPMKSIWAELADEFEADHPGVTIEITPLENEAFKARLTTVTQAGDPPDLFQSWGGGVLEQQIEADLVQDISDDVAPWLDTLTSAAVSPYQVDGKTYGIPFDSGLVGFWYNKALFSQAGITSPPTTWDDLLSAVEDLKAAGITPIAVGGGDKWPAHYYWAYLAMRVAGIDALGQAVADGSFDQPAFVEAGEHLQDLVDLDPFQEGFLAASYGTPDGEAAAMGNGEAAMELMGQWAPDSQAAQSAGGEGIGEDLGFFPFPAVDGGEGSPTDAFGGGNGFAVGSDAPPEAVEFLEFISTEENQRKLAAAGAVLPVTKGAEDAIEDANRRQVADTLAGAEGFQLYLDQAYAPVVGQTVNDSVAALIAGTMNAQDVAVAINDAAKNQ